MKLLFQTILIFTLLINVHAQRGRVQIKDGTVVTDKGTLLRGAFVALDNLWNTIPSRQQVHEIKDLGLNAIHVYAENPYDGSLVNPMPGYSMAEVDSLVKWTAEDSLYLILTMAGWNPSKDSFLYGFWSLYADRYNNKTHLIFEICNEPDAIPFDSLTLGMEKRAYDTIRKYAPETHIMLMSYPYLDDADSAILDINKLGKHIDWLNTSIAGHGYSQSIATNYNFIKQLQDSGYAVTITEPPCFTNGWISSYVNLAYTKILEKEFVSYTHFIEVKKIIDDPYCFKSVIESSKIRWKPDFGTWPMSIDIKHVNPYDPIMAVFHEEVKDIYPFNDSLYLFGIKNDAYVAFFNLDFRNGANLFNIECSSVSNTTIVKIHLDSLNGPLVGECPIQNTQGWYNYKKFSCKLSGFDGVHDLYLNFTDADHYWALGVLKSIVFNEKDANSNDISNNDCIPAKYSADSIAEAYASSISDGHEAKLSVDGNLNTRWSSNFNDREWITIDLGEAKIITGAKLYWETAYAMVYSLQVSNDKENWITVYSTTNGDGGIDFITNLAEVGRYIRMYGLFRDTYWGYSLYELEVYTCNKTTGINYSQQDNANIFLFYPNPAKDFIRVKTDTNAIFEIYNTFGQLMLKEKISKGENVISVGILTKGSYIAKISNNQEAHSKILIVE